MEKKEVYLLMCDDEKHLTKTRMDKFTRIGYKVKIANDGEECLKMIEKEIPDILLLDIKLPGISGIEVLRKLRKKRKTKTLPVIINSVYSSSLYEKATQEYNAVDYLPKSRTRLSAIVEAVNKVRNSLTNEYV